MTALRAAALDGCLVHVLPGLGTTEDIINLLPLQVHLLLEGLADFEDVGTGLAIKTEIGRHLFCEQQVRASRTKQHLLN